MHSSPASPTGCSRSTCYPSPHAASIGRRHGAGVRRAAPGLPRDSPWSRRRSRPRTCATVPPPGGMWRSGRAASSAGHALDRLVMAAPQSLLAHRPPPRGHRYGRRPQGVDLATVRSPRDTLAAPLGRNSFAPLGALYAPDAPARPRGAPALETARRVRGPRFRLDDRAARRRAARAISLAAVVIGSTCPEAAHDARQGSTPWRPSDPPPWRVFADTPLHKPRQRPSTAFGRNRGRIIPSDCHNIHRRSHNRGKFGGARAGVADTYPAIA